MPPIIVSVYYEQQLVPWVMAEIEQGEFGWHTTFNNHMQRDPAIQAELRAFTGSGPDQVFTPYEVGPEGVHYSIAWPLAHAQIENQNIGGNNWMLPPGFGLGFFPAAVAPAAAPPVPVNIYAGVPHVGELNLPAGAESPIGLNLPPAGTEMANFHGEYEKGRVYTRAEFNNLPKKSQHGYKKENPITRKVIEPGNVRYYKSKGGRKSRRKRATKRRRRA